MTNVRKLAGVAVKLLIGILLALVVGEAALRLIRATPLWRVLPVVPPILGQPDRTAGYVLTPGASGIWLKENRAPVTINSLGLRDSEMQAAKPPGVFRVGMTGDSIVEAVQVEQRYTFDALTEAELTRRGHKVEIANLALSGAGPLRQLLQLRRFGKLLNVDLAVSFITPGDFLSGELADDSKNPAYVDDGKGGLVEGTAFRNRFTVRHADDPVFRAALWLVQFTEVGRIAYWQWRSPPVEEGRALGADSGGDSCAGAALAAQRRLWVEGLPEGAWKRAGRLLDDFGAYSRREAIPVIFALRLPVPRGEACRQADADREAVVLRITQEAGNRGIAVVDFSRLVHERLLAGPAAGARLSGFGRMTEGHLNLLGHRIYAGALTLVLEGRLSVR